MTEQQANERTGRTKNPGQAGWTKKRDRAPRGVFRHPSGAWAIRYLCAIGHVHQEQIGRVKSDAKDAHAARRARARSEPGWCPAAEREQARARAESDAARERARILFKTFAEDHYLPYAKIHKRSWRTDASRVDYLLGKFGGKRMDEITPQDIEAVLVELRGDRQPGTVNRYRDLLSSIFKRAHRDGLVGGNPVKATSKLKEPAGRVAFLLSDEEHAVHDALAPGFRPHFLVSINTGLRYSEQMGLKWRDVDMLTGLITITRSKNGHSRHVPMNSVVRSAVMDLAGRRARPNDPAEHVFDPRPVRSKSFFDAAVERAETTLKEAGKDASRLEGYVWHSNRHTFASRLVMAGVDLRTVQELGGWRSLAMVTKYAHLAPAHRQAAVEAIVPRPAPATNTATELQRNFDEPIPVDPRTRAK